MTDYRSINLTREAFLHPVNLGYLLTVCFAALASSGTPWMPTLILTIGLGVELIYLGSVPAQPWFRRHLMVRFEARNQEMDDEKSQFDRLGRGYQKRFLAIKRIHDKIEENYRRMPGSVRLLTQPLTSRMETLMKEYLNLLLLQERLQEYLEYASMETIIIEIRTLQKEMSAVSSERLMEVKKQRLQILEKRLDRHRVVKEKAEVCRSQQETIEDAVRYVYEKSITLSHPEELGGHLDRLISELEETSAIIREMEDYTAGISEYDQIPNV